MNPTRAQRDRQDGAGDAARRCGAREPAAVLCPSALAEIVVLSDLWSPMSEIRLMLAGLSASGAHVL